MSKSTVNQVIQRAVSDAAFRRQLQANPGKALAGFDLTPDERAAITSGDPTRLTTLGVDQRMSKAFGLGGLGDVSKAVIGDTAMGAEGTFIDDGSAGQGSGALISGDAGEGDALVTTPDGNYVVAGETTIDADASGASAVTDFEGSGLDLSLIDPGAPTGGWDAVDETDASSTSDSSQTVDYAGSGTGVEIQDQPSD